MTTLRRLSYICPALTDIERDQLRLVDDALGAHELAKLAEERFPIRAREFESDRHAKIGRVAQLELDRRGVNPGDAHPDFEHWIASSPALFLLEHAFGREVVENALRSEWPKSEEGA